MSREIDSHTMTACFALVALSVKEQINIPNLGIATPFNVPYDLISKGAFLTNRICISNSGNRAFCVIRTNDSDELLMWQPHGSRETLAKLSHSYNDDTKRASVKWLVDGMISFSGEVGLSAGSYIVGFQDQNTPLLWREGRSSTGFMSSSLSWVNLSDSVPVDGKVIFFKKEKMQFVAVNVNEQYIAIRTPAYRQDSHLRVFSTKKGENQAQEMPVPRRIQYLNDVLNSSSMPPYRTVSQRCQWAIEDDTEINLATGKRSHIPKLYGNQRSFFYIGEELFYHQVALSGTYSQLWEWNRSARTSTKIGDWTFYGASENGKYLLLRKSVPIRNTQIEYPQLWMVERPRLD
jgi:hypothetical protein